MERIKQENERIQHDMEQAQQDLQRERMEKQAALQKQQSMEKEIERLIDALSFGGTAIIHLSSIFGNNMNYLNRITVNPLQCGGRPCIRGMRIRVKDVLDLLASGASRTEILEDYPYLEDEDITAVLEYAASQFDHPVLKVA